MARKLYLVAYDVRQPSRLAKALRVVRSFASGGQKSAYECWLDKTDRDELEDQLARVLDTDADSIALIPLNQRTSITTLGTAVEPTDPEFYYIA